MRIGLDGTRILLPTGEGSYSREVIRHLVSGYPEHEFVILTPEQLPWITAPNARQRIYPEVDGLAARLKYAFGMARIIREEKLDVFHNLTNYGLYFAPCPTVTTVHDLGTLIYPDMRSSRLQGLLYKYYLPSLLRKAEALITVSDSTRRDVARYYGLEDSVHTIYHGFDPKQFTPEGNDEEVLSRFALEPGYLLFVGYMVPKKNIQVIIRAMARLKAQACCPKLVIAGKRGYGCEPLIELIRTLDLEDEVLELGYVSDVELPALFRQARLFVFPSRYEGFGLPVLESMACGTPALISDAGSLPELVEDHRCIADPDDVDGWADRIATFYRDDDQYETMVAYARDRVTRFSWERCAEQMISVYSAVCRSGTQANSAS